MEFTQEQLRELLNRSEEGLREGLEELLPKLPQDLFGKKATHRVYGEGRILSATPYLNGSVRFAFRDPENQDGTQEYELPLNTLTITQEEEKKFKYLKTEEDYRKAPAGTICAAFKSDADEPSLPLWYPGEDKSETWLDCYGGEYTIESLAKAERRVIRDGWGNAF